MAQVTSSELIMRYHLYLEKCDGLPTGAVSGFCSMFFKLLEDVRSDDSKINLLILLLYLIQLEKILEMKFTVIIKLIEQKRLTI